MRRGEIGQHFFVETVIYIFIAVAMLVQIAYPQVEIL
jgi:hypothetical protein